ncbi:hypothetical protein [Amycolatopsis sp. NPDC003731]
MFPDLPSLMTINLAATTRLAASVARNADPDTYRTLITQAAELQPLAVAVALVRNLMFITEKAERFELHDHARAMVVALLPVEQWRDLTPWQDNQYRSRSLLNWTSSIHGEEHLGPHSTRTPVRTSGNSGAWPPTCSEPPRPSARGARNNPLLPEAGADLGDNGFDHVRRSP